MFLHGGSDHQEQFMQIWDYHKLHSSLPNCSFNFLTVSTPINAA